MRASVAGIRNYAWTLSEKYTRHHDRIQKDFVRQMIFDSLYERNVHKIIVRKCTFGFFFFK